MRILYITTYGGTLGFFRSVIHSLIENGDIVDIATNYVPLNDLPKYYLEMGCKAYPLSCTRSPFDTGNFKAIREIRKIVTEGDYDIVHCHTPIAAMCTRLACRPLRKKGVKVIYTAHGFHFYKGAPLKNWLVYYPVEWICSRWTDVLITINKEDYALAQAHMHAKRVEHVPGVGIDLQKFALDRPSQEEKDKVRLSIGLAEDDFVLLSVGELIPRKNHAIVIKALSKLKEESCFARMQYIICGKGILTEELKQLAESLGVGERVHFLGYRSDIADICRCSDLFVFMSLQEGLPVALMEAMASGLPVICSAIRGNTDLIEDGVSGCVIGNDPAQLAEAVVKLHADEQLRERYAMAAREHIQHYDLESVGILMRDLYTDGFGAARGGNETTLEVFLQRQALRRKYSIPLQATVLLSVGEVNRNKNHRVVIEALSRIADESIYYIICGQGPLMDELRCLAQRLGVGDRVILAGYCKNIVAIYGMADIFVFPSLREGLPVALMEAMASGLPVICSEIRGNVDLIENDVNGSIAANDADSMAERIVALCQAPQKKWEMAQTAIESLQAFSVESVLKKMRGIYSDTMQKVGQCTR